MKTLKDCTAMAGGNHYPECHLEIHKNLQKAAIEWIKKYKNLEKGLVKFHFQDNNIEIPADIQRNAIIVWITEFFNLTEEDLK